MPNRALSEKRPILLASMAAALAFFVMRQSPLPELFLVPLKGAGVGLLALYAFMRHRGRDAYHMGAIMIVAALGDIAMEVDPIAGALLFAGYHLGAIGLYLRHPRDHVAATQKVAAAAMVLLTPVIFWLLPFDRAEALPAALYGLAVGGMAACAWLSAFSRYRVGLGAVLFLVSDTLIVAGYGPLMGQEWQQWLIWPLYYTGQFLICIGVLGRLRRRL
ncbi:lysoplasmalogenase family protein [Croceibacterium aestuarii]|uniref:lysoplasmalogenase family protein n=1 Tax=Croceibacterium aestuarii TaxID=3064139 RepID=UPI00272E8D4B|nr:lysoplasmalogenase family protein [Croceibacterium sp. D39]